MPQASRLRHYVTAAFLSLTSGVVMLGMVEVALHLRPTLLGQDFANGALSRYGTGPRGIYYYDQHLHMNFMIPNHSTTMYYNGFVWTHRTDSLGFRNRPLAVPSDVVLLGDSFIYGHGVEFDSTVGALLAEQTGLRVANLARQGDGAFQEAYLLTEYIGVFRPRYVFYFFFENDFSDLDAYLTPAEMGAFINQPLDAIRYPAREPAEAVRERLAQNSSLRRRLWDGLYLRKAWKWMKWRINRRQGDAGSPGPHDPYDSQSLEWRYTRKAIAYMGALASSHGANLVVVPIIQSFPEYRDRLHGLAKELSLDYIDTGALTLADSSLWLPMDGHFSPRGARSMARLVARYLELREKRRSARGVDRPPHGENRGLP